MMNNLFAPTTTRQKPQFYPMKRAVKPVIAQTPPIIAAPQRQTKNFKGYYAKGGKLKKKGEYAIVGEQGPEVVVQGDDETKVIPMPNVQTLGGIDPNEAVSYQPTARSSAVVAPPPSNDLYGQSLNPARFDMSKPYQPTTEHNRLTENTPQDIGHGLTDDVLTASPPIAKSRREQALAERAAPVEKEKSFWKRMLRGAMMGLAQGGGLGNVIGGAIGGGLTAGFYPKGEMGIRKAQRDARLDREIQTLEGERTSDQRYRAGETAIQNTLTDNERLAEDARTRAENRKERLATQRRDSFRRRNPYFDPTKATDAQKRELTEFGETPESMGGYDFTKRDTKKVGGVTFAYDPIQKKYVDTGLPSAPGEESAEIEILDPVTNKVMTMQTTSAKKAQMLNSRIVAQMSAEAAAQRQSSQQTFQAGENDKNRVQVLQIARERIDIAKENLRMANERLHMADVNNKASAEADVRKAKEATIRLKVYLKNSPLILSDDPLWAELDGIDQ